MSRSASLSHLIVGAGALVVGLVISGATTRGEVRELRAEIEQLERRECRSGPGIGAEIANALRGQPLAFDGAPDPRPAAAAPPVVDAPDEPVELPVPVAPVVEAPGGLPFEPGEEMDAIAETMELRRRQAEQALYDHGALDRAQQEAATEVIEGLNAELGALAGDFVEVFQHGEPGRRESMLFARDALDLLVDAESGLMDLMSDDQLDGLDPSITDPFNYVDSRVLWALSELDRR